MAQGRKTSNGQWQRFLLELAMTLNIRRSARLAGLSRSTVYKMRSRDEGFAAIMDAVLAHYGEGQDKVVDR